MRIADEGMWFSGGQFCVVLRLVCHARGPLWASCYLSFGSVLPRVCSWARDTASYAAFPASRVARGFLASFVAYSAVTGIRGQLVDTEASLEP